MNEPPLLTRYAVEILVTKGPEAITAAALADKAGISEACLDSGTMKILVEAACQQVAGELFHSESARRLAFEWLDAHSSSSL